MFFKKWIQESNKKIFHLKKKELNYVVLKGLSKDFSYNISDRIYFLRNLVSFTKYSYFSKFTFYCVLSKNPRSILRNFKCSRLFFKANASKGFIMGLRKASF